MSQGLRRAASPSLSPPRLNAAPSPDSPGPVRRLRRLTTPLRRLLARLATFKRVVRRLRRRRGGAAPAAQIVRGRTRNAGAFRCLRLPQWHDPLNGYPKDLILRRCLLFCLCRLLKDRKCFVATAAAPVPQNGGTRCVFGVPPARQILDVRLCPTP